MKREIITTADGSKTIQIKDWEEQYHSKHGAVQEAYHVFIKNGLELFQDTELDILEIGFGTGLNALITLKESGRLKLNIGYTGVEAYPISRTERQQLDYITSLKAESLGHMFDLMHDATWEKEVIISDNFRLKKEKKDFKKIASSRMFDLIYFDAFGARVQPELWTVAMFKKMYEALRTKGYLVTYAAKGSVRRAMQEVGFEVERLPGPPGKREMLRGHKV
ncbi:tRNA (5-methylaminomethyl-2-thiouridine)(34)-methyltransferase MnmD [Maribacter aestuarii]|uniref:tRNA (5-methylaminomethyl-2-thiouridine)(34)-methyltransferase MnmD n=1 Tax=Maribacter aestuarii TaxID=1130723 RepID=UPI00248AF910|nr:tRNA (5-methylaminomethyl-2-thiouridine)(34)-methyltransferase MnmD [Maribacter aestuarii]